jgi:hypothetical protein
MNIHVLVDDTFGSFQRGTPIKILPTIPLLLDTGYISQGTVSIIPTNVTKENSCDLLRSLIITYSDFAYIHESIRFVFLKHILYVRVSENNPETLNKVLNFHFQQTLYKS